MFTTTAEVLLLVVAALFPVLNPFGAALIAQGMMVNLDDTTRKKLAAAVALNCLLMLAGATLVGTYVLAFFGISIPALRVAGGVMLAVIAFRLLMAPSADAAAPLPRETALSQAFYPLTLPLIVGPGSISVAVAMGTEQINTTSPAHLVGAILGLVLLAATIYLCMRYVERLCRFFGTALARVIERLSSLILLCIGMQLGWHGIAQLVGIQT